MRGMSFQTWTGAPVLAVLILGLLGCGGGGGGSNEAAASPTPAGGSAPVSGAPGAPTEVSAQAQDQAASIAFAPPAGAQASSISSYTATCVSASGTAYASAGNSPIVVYGLGNGVSYTCSVQASNASGTGPASASVSVVPAAPVLVTIDPTRLPVGDGKLTTTMPQVGYLYVCSIPSSPNPPGKSPWIRADGTWDSTAKVVVQGAVSWPEHRFQYQSVNAFLSIRGNGLPDHPTGIFPIAATDPARQYDGNPNPITAQTIAWLLALDPVVAAEPSCTHGGAIGILLTGAMLYNAADADGRDAVAHETQDACGGHPQSAGQYHYHSDSRCHAHADPAGQHSPLIGYIADGFGLYGNLGEGGVPLVNADLDVCHGHTHRIDWQGQERTMYHYHATQEFPYTVGCYKGAPANLH